MKKPTKEKLNEIDLSPLKKHLLSNRVEEGYFDRPAGVEHYRLLAWISSQFDNVTITEIGTLDGMGLIALSYNPKNYVISWDIRDYRWKNEVPQNAIRRLLTPDYMDEVVKSPVIFYDAAHEGKEERDFVAELIKRKWKGMLILDDIHLNQEMIDFWNCLPKNLIKEDWSDIGHACGTGIVFFE